MAAILRSRLAYYRNLGTQTIEMGPFTVAVDRADVPVDAAWVNNLNQITEGNILELKEMFSSQNRLPAFRFLSHIDFKDDLILPNNLNLKYVLNEYINTVDSPIDILYDKRYTVVDTKDMSEWIELATHGFELSTIDIMSSVASNADYLFKGKLSGDARWGAVGAMCCFEDVAYLHAGATLPESRGKGLNYALLEHRVRMAHRLGCKLISLDTNNPYVQNNLQKLSFQLFARQICIEIL